MASSAAAAPLELGSIEVLKRIKATETEWEEKLTAARRDSESTLARLRSEADQALAAARAETETERAAALERAHAEVEKEVAEIFARGEVEAKDAGSPAGKRPSDHRDQVIALVFGPFAPE